MFKKYRWLLVFIYLPFTLNGQEYYTWYQAGLTAKMVSAKMTIDSDLVSLSNTESEIGYQLGVFGRINIENVYVEPQLLFSNIKSQLSFQNYGGVSGFDPLANFEFRTLEFPVDIGMRFGNFRINTGPSLSLLLSAQRSFLNDLDRVTTDYNRLSILWHFGIGGDFDKLMIDLKYEFGLSKTGESLSNLIGSEFIPKQRQWVFAIGFNFLNDF